MRRLMLAATLVALVLPASAQADYKRCRPVLNTLKSSYGSDLYRLRAQATSCRTARRVARQGTRAFLHGGFDAFGWLIAGNYVGNPFEAQADWPQRIRWTFGELGFGRCGYVSFSVSDEADDNGVSVISRDIRCPAARREVTRWFGRGGDGPAARGWDCEQIDGGATFGTTRCDKHGLIITYTFGG